MTITETIYPKGSDCPWNGQCQQDSVGLELFCNNCDPNPNATGFCVLNKTITITVDDK